MPVRLMPVRLMHVALHVADIVRSRDFYRELLDLEVVFDTDWIVQLRSPDAPASLLMLQPRDHELVPPAFRTGTGTGGTSVVFVVDDCDAVHERALRMAAPVVQPPGDEYYGQRRVLLRDPDGVLVDVSSPCEPSPEFVARYRP